MTMEVKKVKYKNTKLYKTQTEVTYSERGNGAQMKATQAYSSKSHLGSSYLCPLGLR